MHVCLCTQSYFTWALNSLFGLVAGKLAKIQLDPEKLPTSLENGQCLPDFQVSLLDAWGYSTIQKSQPAVKTLRLELTAAQAVLQGQQQQDQQVLLRLDSPATDDRAETSSFPCSQMPVLLTGLREPVAVQLTVLAVAEGGSEVAGVTGVRGSLELQPSTKPVNCFCIAALKQGRGRNCCVWQLLQQMEEVWRVCCQGH